MNESSLPARVTSAEVARVLGKVEQVQQLRHFMTPAGSTVSEFAAVQNWPHLKAYRQVKTFERVGLLQVCHSEKRSGRAVQFYRCPHQRYFLPASLVSIEDYLHQSFQPHEGQIKHELAEAAQSGENPVAGLLVGAFGDGVALLPADRDAQPWSPDAPESPAMFFGIGPLFLDYPQAKALQAELQEVFERYGQQAGGARYLYQVIFTPDSKDEGKAAGSGGSRDPRPLPRPSHFSSETRCASQQKFPNFPSASQRGDRGTPVPESAWGGHEWEFLGTAVLLSGASSGTPGQHFRKV